MVKMHWLGVGITAVSLPLAFFIFSSLNRLALAQDAPPTPTVDRLAAPPTVPAPTQADEGEQLFWLYCQPCHGDQGQGLTDEWRAQFPEEEQTCWQSGCHSGHGKDLPEYGFVLPTAVPAVIGAGSLDNFETAQQFYFYIRSAMPYEAPGSLTGEEYLAITAYLVRAHGLGDSIPLDNDNVAEIRFRPLADDAVSPETSDIPDGAISQNTTPSFAWYWGSGITLFIIAGTGWLWRQRKQ